MPLVKTMCHEFHSTMKCHLSLLWLSCWYQRPPVSKYVSENPGGDCIGFYKVPPSLEHNGALAALLQGPWYFSNNLPSMCLSVLDQVVWRRRAGKEGRQNPARLHVRSPQIQRDCWLCVFVCVCVCVCVCACMCFWETEVAAIQLCQHELWSDLHRHRDTHTKHLIAKKKVSPGLHCV